MGFKENLAHPSLARVELAIQKFFGCTGALHPLKAGRSARNETVQSLSMFIHGLLGVKMLFQK